MTRLLLTFDTLFKVLTADQTLSGKIATRTTPTPPGLSASICSISLELIDPRDEELAIKTLAAASLKPDGVHLLVD